MKRLSLRRPLLVGTAALMPSQCRRCGGCVIAVLSFCFFNHHLIDLFCFLSAFHFTHGLSIKGLGFLLLEFSESLGSGQSVIWNTTRPGGGPSLCYEEACEHVSKLLFRRRPLARYPLFKALRFV